MKIIVIVTGVIAAIWYGTWEGLVEPSLPKHVFEQADLEQLLFGAICAFVAFHLYVRDAGSTQEERVERLERASVFAMGNLAVAMSCVFMLPTVTNFEAVAYPYFELAADLTRLLPWRNQHDEIPTGCAVFALSAPILMSWYKAAFASAASVIALRYAADSKVRCSGSTGELMDAAFWMTGFFHLVVGVAGVALV